MATTCCSRPSPAVLVSGCGVARAPSVCCTYTCLLTGVPTESHRGAACGCARVPSRGMTSRGAHCAGYFPCSESGLLDPFVSRTGVGSLPPGPFLFIYICGAWCPVGSVFSHGQSWHLRACHVLVGVHSLHFCPSLHSSLCPSR